MAFRRATYTGLNNVMDAFDAATSQTNFYYSVWYTDTEPAFQYVGDDRDKAREFLMVNLQAMEQAGNDDILLLKYHPVDKKEKYITRKTPVVAAVPFRVVALDTNEVTGIITGSESGRLPYSVQRTLEDLKNLPGVIDQKIDAAIEAKLLAIDGDDEPEIEQTALERTLEMITGITNNPQVMGAIGTVLGYLKPQPAQYFEPRMPINGMNIMANENPDVQEIAIDENVVNDALERLSVHCRIDTDLQLLAAMAEKNPGQFKMLLGMLRG